MSAAAAVIASPTEGPGIRATQAEDTTLHPSTMTLAGARVCSGRTVVARENVKTLYAALEEQGTQMPAFIRDELDGFLWCGLLCRGFRLLRCDDCRESSVGGVLVRRQRILPVVLGQANGADGSKSRRARFGKLRAGVLRGRRTAAPMGNHIPILIALPIAHDGELLGAVGHLFTDSVLGFYRRRMALEGIARAQAERSDEQRDLFHT